MDSIFEVVTALAKAIGYLLQFIFEVITEFICFPMMIAVLVTFVYSRRLKLSDDRWERRASVFLAFFNLMFDLCFFLPA